MCVVCRVLRVVALLLSCDCCVLFVVRCLFGGFVVCLFGFFVVNCLLFDDLCWLIVMRRSLFVACCSLLVRSSLGRDSRPPPPRGCCFLLGS